MSSRCNHKRTLLKSRRNKLPWLSLAMFAALGSSLIWLSARADSHHDHVEIKTSPRPKSAPPRVYALKHNKDSSVDLIHLFYTKNQGRKAQDSSQKGYELKEEKVSVIPKRSGGSARGVLSRTADYAYVISSDPNPILNSHGLPSDYAATLWQVDLSSPSGSRPSLALKHKLYETSLPFSSQKGFIFVQSGEEGPWPSPSDPDSGMFRTDLVRIEKVDEQTGALYTFYKEEAYLLHIAGEHDEELVVYRVSKEGAAILGIAFDTGKARTIANILPFARDFSIDSSHERLLFSNRDEKNENLWHVVALDLKTGHQSSLRQSYGSSLSPLATSSDSDAYTWTSPDHQGFESASAPFLHQQTGSVDSLSGLLSSKGASVRPALMIETPLAEWGSQDKGFWLVRRWETGEKRGLGLVYLEHDKTTSKAGNYEAPFSLPLEKEDSPIELIGIREPSAAAVTEGEARPNTEGEARPEIYSRNLILSASSKGAEDSNAASILSTKPSYVEVR